MEDPELEEKTIQDLPTLEKYKAAAVVANTVMAALIAKAKPGVKVVELCQAGDDLIAAETAKVYKKNKTILKGVAFPTCVSINNIAGHFSPASKDDKTAVAEGDVLKIDLAVHFDGYVSTFAHTIVATNKPEEAISGKKADVICAAYFASEAALHLLKAGNTNEQVTSALKNVASDFGVNVVEGVLSHKLKQYVIDGNDVIISKETPTEHVEKVEFQDFEVWSIDVVMSTGEGKPKPGDAKTTIYKRASDDRYNLKQASARELLTLVTKQSNTLAWSLRSVQSVLGAKALLGLREMTEHNMLNEFPVLYEKNKEFIAQFKFTVIILPTKTEKLNNAPLPFVSSEKKVVNAEVAAALAAPLTRVKKSAAPAADAAAAAAAAPAAAAQEPAK